MSAKAVPQIQKSATPITAVTTNAGLGSVRLFTDERANLEQESSSSDSQVAATAPPPPEKPSARAANSTYNFSRISVSDYAPATVQSKLVVGAAGDKYEQEADAMADRVMSMTSSVQKQEESIQQEPEIQTQPLIETAQQNPEEEGTVHLKSVAETAQRKSEEEGTVHLKALAETIQRKEIEGVVHLKPLSDRVSPAIQQTLKDSTLISRKGDSAFTASDSIETRLKSGKGGGQPLPNETRDFMDTRFSNDFSGVKVHTGSDAVQLSKELGAQAFTHGEDIYFNSGKYSPHTDEGKKLLAHELTHTIQQTGPKIKTKPLKTSHKQNKVQRQKTFAKSDVAPANQEISQLKASGKILTKPDEKKDEKDSAKPTENLDKDKQKPQDQNKGNADAGSGKEQQSQPDETSDTAAKADKSEATADGKTAQDSGGQDTEGGTAAKEGDTGSGGDVTGEGSPSADVAFEAIDVSQDPNRKAPDSPEADPAFQAVIKQTQGVSTQYTQHPAPEKKAAEAQQAAVDPKQQERDAQATKVEQTSQKEPKAFDRASFEKAILDKLGIAVPKNLKEADNFSKSNKLGEVKGQLTQTVEHNKQEAGGGLPQANQTPPDPSAEQPKATAPIPDVIQDVGKEQPTVEADKAVPKEKSEQEIEKPLEQTAENLDQTFGEIQPKLVVGAPGDKYEVEADQMAERVMAMPEPKTPQPEESASYETESTPANSDSQPQIQNQIEPIAKAENATPINDTESEELLAGSIQRVQLFIQRKEALEAQSVQQPEKAVPLNQERLGTWGEAGGSQAITALKDAKKNTIEGSKEYRQEEEGQLTTAKGEAVGEADKTNQEMFSERDASMKEVGASQEQTKTEDEQKREKVTADIDKIYKQTKDSVDARLKKLDNDVDKEFERGSHAAKQKFEGYVGMKMAAYKDKRYNKFGGSLLWLKDKFLGMPSEVNKFYEEGKKTYIDEMKKSISKIASIVETGLNEAKGLVDKGRQEVNVYVQSLPEDLKQVGADSAANIQSQFDSLEQSVKDKQNQLVDSLAQKYQTELQELDKRIDKLKEENKGLVDKALQAIAALAKAIIKAVLTPIKAILEALIGDMASKVIDAIIDDPIKFMKDLFKGIGDGIKNFASNIGKHLLNGLVTWLFGNIGAELKLPEKFDLKGFLDILLQVLGLTKDYIFGLVEQILGTNVVELIKFIIDFMLKNGADSLKILWDLVKMIGEVGIDAIMFLITEGVDAITSLPETVQNALKSFGGIEPILGFAENLIGSLSEGVLELVGGLAKGAKFLFDFFSTLFTQGISATWVLLKSSLGTLKELFMGEITTMLIMEVVQKGIMWLISILVPGAGVLKAAKAIFDVIKFFIEKKDEVKAFVDSILTTLKSIINGDIGAMAKGIEDALARAIPTVLGFLASLLGIGGIPSKIKKFFTKLREPITKIVNGIFSKATAFFKGIGKSAKKGYKRAKTAVKKGYNKAKTAVKKGYNKAKTAVKKGYNKAKTAVKKGYNKAKTAVKKGYNKAKTAVKNTFQGGPKDKNKKKGKPIKDNPKARIKEAFKAIQGLAKNTRDPEKIKNNLSGISSKNKLHKLKLNKKGKLQYQIVGNTKLIKAQRQAEAGASLLPLRGVANEGFQHSEKFTAVQLKNANPWEDRKNKVTIKNKVTGSNKKANFNLTGKLLAQNQDIKKISAKLKEIIKNKIDYKSVSKTLPGLKEKYQLKSLTASGLNKDKSEYQIVGEASPQGATKAQREAISGAANAIATDGVEEAIQRSAGKGQELTSTVREPMENAFGFDFGRVRIHDDTEGDRLSRSLEARAFTSGEDIFFRQGAYAPNSPSGKKLLAHELTHVVQQSSEAIASSGNPFFTRTAQRVSEGVPHFVQRQAEETEDNNSTESENANKEATKAQIKAVGMGLAAKAVSYGIDRAFSSSEKPTIKESLKGNKFTLKVSVSKPEKQEEAEQEEKEKEPVKAEEEQLALPNELVQDIVGLIQKIVNQAPQPDIVQKKLDKVRADFNLDGLQVVSTATIGSSFTYDIRIKGNGQNPEKNAKEVSQGIDNMGDRGGTLIDMAVGWAVDKAFEKVGKAFKSKSSKPAAEKSEGEKAKDDTPEPPEEVKPEEVKNQPPTEKEKAITEEGKDTGTSASKQKGGAAKPPLTVNTEIKRIDTATVEVSVRANPQQQKKEGASSPRKSES